MMLRKYSLQGYGPAEKGLDEILNEPLFGIYRIIKPEDAEYKQPLVQGMISSHRIRDGEIARVPLAAYQNSFLEFPRMTDMTEDYEINTKKKAIIPGKRFPGRCFGGHVESNMYYFHGSFEDFMDSLKQLGYKLMKQK